MEQTAFDKAVQPFVDLIEKEATSVIPEFDSLVILATKQIRDEEGEQGTQTVFLSAGNRFAQIESANEFVRVKSAQQKEQSRGNPLIDTMAAALAKRSEDEVISNGGN